MAGIGWQARVSFGAIALALPIWAPGAAAQTTTCDPADSCCTQCETGSPDCPQIPFEDFDDFSTTRDAWLAQLVLDECGMFSGGRSVAVGTCATGAASFLYRRSFFVGTVRFYDDQGAFIAQTTASDVIDPVCGNETYFPAPAPCTSPVVTEIHCTEIWVFFGGLSVGDPVYLPATTQPVTVPAMGRGLALLGALLIAGLGGCVRRSRSCSSPRG